MSGITLPGDKMVKQECAAQLPCLKQGSSIPEQATSILAREKKGVSVTLLGKDSKITVLFLFEPLSIANAKFQLTKPEVVFFVCLF